MLNNLLIFVKMLNNIEFANPEFLYALGILPLLIVWYVLRNKKMNPSLSISDTSPFGKVKKTMRQRLRHLLFLLRICVLSAVIVAIARPQTTSSKENITTEGIDIVMAMDVSSSMLAQDLKPNRIKAAKKTAMEFITKRPNDRIGLVAFAGESFPQCPITIDHDVLRKLTDELKTGVLQDGTAIGSGLATAVNRLKDTDGKSKVIILLTDGRNNQGVVSPETAADIAKTFNVRVYTIGVGTRGQAPYPMETAFGTRTVMMEVEIDEDILTKIADVTGGKYFRATSTKALKNIYEEIDKLEKNKIDVAVYNRKTEEFLPFLLLGLGLLGLETILRYTIFKTVV
jgi:Ca-activated chloride channel family protein